MDNDLQQITLQEHTLVLPHFDQAVAWELGNRLRAESESRHASITIEIRIARETVFFYAMPGTAAVNADWARRKRNTVELLGRSSYGIGRSMAEEGESLESLMGLATRDYCSHGGGFPITVKGLGVIGVVTVSGLPQREDHEMVVQVLAEMCDMDPQKIALSN